MGAARRPPLSGVWRWMEPVLGETGLGEVLVDVSVWRWGWVCVSGPSLGSGVQVQQGGCEHKLGQTLLGSLLPFCSVVSLGASPPALL